MATNSIRARRAPQFDRFWPPFAVLAATVGPALFLLTGLVSYQHRVASTDLQAGWPNAVWLAAWLSYGVVGGLILHRIPRHWMGRLFVAITLSVQAAALLDALALAMQRDAWPGHAVAAVGWLSGPLFLAPQLALITVLPLLYPSGRLPRGRRRVLLRCSLLAGTVLLAGVAVAPGRLDGLAQDNPIGLSSAPGVASALQYAGAIGVVLMCVLCAGSLALVWRRGSPDDRRALAYLAVAVGVIALTVVSSVLLAALAGDGPRRYTGLFEAAALMALPAATGMAILRAQLFDIELVLRRTLTYFVVSVLVAGVYVLTVVLLGRTFRVSDRLSVSLVVLALAAAGLSPLRERIQRQVDRVLYGRRGDPYGVLLELDQRLSRTTSAAGVLPALTKTIADGLQVPYVGIVLQQAPGTAAVKATHGVSQPVARDLELRHHGVLVGHLQLAARSPGERFSSLDDQLLAQVVDHVSAAVAAVRLSIEAQQSRERLVRALEEDRRRIRRDLHDHLGPVLGGVSLQLDALGRLTKDQPQLQELAGTIRKEVGDAIQDVRRLVHGMRPPVLDELGLADAVRHYAASLSEALHVSVTAPVELPPLPAAVEVAAYRIVTEALTNCVKHAGAASSHVSLSWSTNPDTLTVDVGDDGKGMPTHYRNGVGLHSMRERAAELGGTLTISSDARGASVHAELPSGAQ